MSGPFYNPVTPPQAADQAALGNLHARTRALEAANPSRLVPAVYAIKLTEDQDSSPDAQPAVTVNGAFYIGIPPELDGWYVTRFWGYQTTPGSLGTDTQLRLTKTIPTGGVSNTVTPTRVVIPDNGYWPSQQAVIDTTVNQVIGEYNMLRVDIYDVDGAYGVSCEVTLRPSNIIP